MYLKAETHPKKDNTSFAVSLPCLPPELGSLSPCRVTASKPEG